MTDAIPSDHPTVGSARVECSQVGRTGRPQLLLSPEHSITAGETLRLVLDGTQRYAPVVSALDDGPAIEAAYANRRLARTAEGANLLREWLDDRELGPGSTLVVDELVSGYAYGLREPGERVLYEPIEEPDSSLTDIARSLEDDR